jgi:hypothetical protein
MSRVGVTRGLIVSCDLLKSSSDIKVLQYSLEHSERGLGLVERYFVTSLVNPKEADC